jgi:hypothetical protein
LLFTTDAAPLPGEELSFSLPLVGADRVSMIGLVTRVRGPEDLALVPEGETAISEVAVRFTRITAVDQDRVVRFILITEHRRREAILREPPAPSRPATPTLQAVPPMASAMRPAVVPGEGRAAAGVAPVMARPAPIAPLEAVAKDVPVLPPIDPNLCEQSDIKTVRLWFDSLEPFSRIELLSMLQANMAGSPVAGAPEPASVRPLAVALGLLAG